MEFRFTDEQLMIRETAETFLRDHSTSAAIRQAMATEQGYDPALWERLCHELCFQAIAIPESHGGMGLGYVELVAVLEQMGRFLLCSPYFATVCLAAQALTLAADDAQQAAWFARILAGETAALLHHDRSSPVPGNASARYTARGDGYVLDGSYRHIIDGHTASFYIVAADGDRGVGLFAVPADLPGISRRWTPTVDQTRKQADVALAQVAVPAAQCLKLDAARELAIVLDLARVALAAEQVGVAQQTLDMTVAYTKQRVQFNRPVGSFQAVKHQMADMMLRAEVARSAAYYAACVADDLLRQPRAGGDDAVAALAEAASIAKAYCSEACFRNAGDALQLHGGVGFTWEYDVHLYFKRAKSSEILLGNGAWHREQVAKRLLDL